ncbi:hypothetical protein SDC9_83640 [bioreactor metagenome]|uniref:Uncharacterized protein n=1 Tax=bioreactor metagenome TaxID=1076179 RepID=A0A644Z827_9ZZZZ
MHTQRVDEQKEQHDPKRRCYEPEHNQPERGGGLCDHGNRNVAKKRNCADQEKDDDAGQLARKLNQSALKPICVVYILKVVRKQSVAEPNRKIHGCDDHKEQNKVFLLLF